MKRNKDLVVVITSSELGQGQTDLGEKLTSGFFKVLSSAGECPGKIFFLNSGIFLTTEGSGVVDFLKALEDQGAEILSCSTCLNYHNRMDQLVVGKAGDMNDTVRAMLEAGKVITL